MTAENETQQRKDMLYAHRYLYYVRATPVISDREYDRMEDDYELKHGELPVGSDCESDYTDEQIRLAESMI